MSALGQPTVIAADRGATTALKFGFVPHVVVGDLDSIDAPTLRELHQRGVPIETHPRDKDATDGQLAIARALQFSPSELVLLGFLGGPRLDQALANVLLLIGLEIPAVLLDERNECVLVRPSAPYAWRTETTEVVSLLPLNGDAGGVRTRGLRWPLNAEPLRVGDTRGVSNEPIATTATVSIEQGLLLVTRHFPP
jgi:thiamine pyrophosphokinase